MPPYMCVKMSVESFHTRVGVSVWMVLVNKSTVVPIDTYAGFFSSLPTTSTNQRSFSHTHMEASTHHPPRQQINANFDAHVLGYRFEWCLSTNQRWSRTTPIQDFFGVYPPRQRINAHFHTHVLGYQSGWPLSYSVKCKIYADMILRFQQSDFHVTAEIFFGPYIYIVRGHRGGHSTMDVIPPPSLGFLHA